MKQRALDKACVKWRGAAILRSPEDPDFRARVDARAAEVAMESDKRIFDQLIADARANDIPDPPKKGA